MKQIFRRAAGITVITVCACGGLKGQQTQPYTQYLFNRYLLNPAACGSDGFSSIGLVIKDQWTGFSAAPSTQTFTAQARVPREGLFGTRTRRSTGFFSPENVGVGISLFNDMRGPIRTTGAQLTYAYHLEDRTGQLSFGLSVNMFQLFLDRDKMITEFEDFYLNNSDLNTFVPDAIFGLHYTTHTYYVGISAANVFQSFLMLGGRNSSSYRIERQYNLLGGYIFDLNPEWSLVPSLQVKTTDRRAMQLDVNLNLYYFDQFWGGLAYRTGGGGVPGGVSAMFGARYKQYYFGYAFDYSMSSIRKYSYGSHELMAVITFRQTERFFRYNRRYEYQTTRGSSGR
ncbi:MAG: type IX secretion system membrane protein PorP/SprF [Bacteroidales bacterium]|nr:type IX secretion system membrane protein PorP/SprF [Bacteroidales bacterium]